MKHAFFTLLLLNVSSVYANSAPSSLLTHTIGVIAKSTAAVEIAQAMSLINQAIDKLDTKSADTLANASLH